MLRLDLKVMGVQATNRRIIRIGDRAMNLKPAYDMIHSRMMDIIEKQFDSEGTHRGSQWEPLAPSTLRKKGSAGGSILVFSGAYKDSLTKAGDPNHIYYRRGDLVRIGTKLPYGPLHQTGTDHMPKRPVVQMNESDRRMMVKIIHHYVVTGRLL